MVALILKIASEICDNFLDSLTKNKNIIATFSYNLKMSTSSLATASGRDKVPTHP